MTNQISKNIILPKSAIRKKEGIVILPLRKWKKIEETLDKALEDLEMYQSKNLAGEIERTRRQVKKGEIISLEKLEKKLK